MIGENTKSKTENRILIEPMPENSKFTNPNSQSKFVWIAFALVIIFVYFFGLTIPLIGPDEPRYAQIAREMFERNDWITPKLGNFDWFEKPALLYWLEIAAYKIFGVSEFAARVGSAVFGLGTIACLWLLGRKSETGSRKPEGKILNSEANSFLTFQTSSFANWLALAAASSVGLLVFSRAASFDIIVTFPLTAALVAFYFFDQNERQAQNKNRIYSFSAFYFPLAVFYIFVGVALIAKGLIGIVFPFAIVGFYYILSWRLPSKTFIFSLFWGTMLTLLAASVWYLPMYRANGWKFIDEFIIQHHFQRFTSDKYQHHQPFWFFFAVLPLLTLPWLPFFLTSIWNLIKVQFSKFKSDKTSPNLRVSVSPLLVFAFAWMLVPLVFFSISGSKLPGYILPALPAALVLTAQSVERFVKKSAARKFAVQFTAFAVFAVVIVLLQFVAVDYTKEETVKTLIETANAKGFERENIVSLYTVSHNLEFYAPGRLIREDDGKLKRYDDFSVLVKEMKAHLTGKILAVVPQKDAPNVADNGGLAKVEILAENGESAIVAVEAK